MPFVLLCVAGAIYEAAARREHRRWSAEYDAEGLLERVTVASEDPELLWEYRPGARHEWLEINQHGFREREVPRPKPEGEFRIAVVGDSVALGWGVPVEQTFVRRLEAAAHSAGRAEVRTLNFAVDGYHTLQVKRLVETRVLDFDPDMLLYALCLNDFDFEDASARKIDYFEPPRSFLWRRIRRAVRNRTSPRDDHHLRHFDWTRAEVCSAIVELDRDCARAGVDFHLIVVPAFYDAPDFERYPAGEIHEALRTLTREQGLRAIDLLPLLENEGIPPRELAADLWHLRERGHEVVAAHLAREMFGPPR